MSTRQDNAKEWEKVLASKTVQGLAAKIDKCRAKEGEARDLVEMLVRKWAELVKVRNYFPDLKDVFTPDAVFCIEYAHRQLRKTQEDPATRLDNYPQQVYDVLTYISNLVANHDYSPGELKRLYNRKVAHAEACTGNAPILPMFDIGETIDRRLSVNKERFIPQGVPVKKERKKRPPRSHILAAVSNSNVWTELRGDWQQFIKKIEGDAK
jgi:hypothetical protein